MSTATATTTSLPTADHSCDPVTIGIVSISDRASTGVYEDKGLPALQDWLGRALHNPIQFEARLIPDEQATISATLTELGRGAVANPGAHGFSEILYAFTSMANNNGSAFAGLSANNALYNLLGGLAMFTGRFWAAIPVLALAGSLAAKKTVPAGTGTLPTHTPLFCGLLVTVVLVVGALTFIPALALGPIAEHLQMLGR